jgi:acyl-CoA synthetase (NDP forming)
MRSRPSPEQVEALLYPLNIVIVGASDRTGSWSRRAYESSRAKGYQGRIYLVNPRYDQLLGEPCFKSLADLAERPDHLLIYVKAELVPSVIRQGAALGARSATIISAGFQEDTSSAGRALSRDLESAIVETGLAVSGPNCLGTINIHNGLCSMSEDSILCNAAGPVAIVSQSGGMARFLNRGLAERGLNASYVVSTGNEIGLNIADYIAYFSSKPDIKTILCYNEFIHDIESLNEACRRAHANEKIVVVARFGESQKGKAAALAHTGALAGSLDVFESKVRELGIIRVDSLDEMLEVAELAVHLPRPAGKRIAALTISGAFNAFLTDVADRHGLIFPDLSSATHSALEDRLGAGASVGNPLDAGFAAMSSEKIFGECLEILQSDPNIDALIIQEELPREVATAGRTVRHLPIIAEYAAKHPNKPICLVSMLSHSQSDYSRALRQKYPNLAFLQDPKKALKALSRYISMQGVTSASVENAHDCQATSPTKTTNGLALSERQSLAVLEEFGVCGPPNRQVVSLEEANAFAREVEFPVVAKIISSSIMHKSDIGGVIVGIQNEMQLAQAYKKLTDLMSGPRYAGKIDGILLVKQVDDSVEVVLSLINDPEFGPTLMIGWGGILVELIKDVRFISLPTNRYIIRSELEKTKVYQLLSGYRGRQLYDVDALVEAAERLSRLIERAAEKYEVVEINPLAVCRQGNGAFALDAMITLRSDAASIQGDE